MTVNDALPPPASGSPKTISPTEPGVGSYRASSGGGTLLRMTETGFRERGWEVAVLEQQYREHVTGWDHFLPRLAPYVATLVARP